MLVGGGVHIGSTGVGVGVSVFGGMGVTLGVGVTVGVEVAEAGGGKVGGAGKVGVGGGGEGRGGGKGGRRGGRGGRHLQIQAHLQFGVGIVDTLQEQAQDNLPRWQFAQIPLE